MVETSEKLGRPSVLHVVIRGSRASARRATRLASLAIGVLAAAQPASAEDAASPSNPAPDKSGHTLFNPTPDDEMRKFTPDRPALFEDSGGDVVHRCQPLCVGGHTDSQPGSCGPAVPVLPAEAVPGSCVFPPWRGCARRPAEPGLT